jgi:hypothetical protein
LTPCSSFPHTPPSQVRATPCCSDGSPAIAFGSLQGCDGSAQPRSIEVGARLPSLYQK